MNEVIISFLSIAVFSLAVVGGLVHVLAAIGGAAQSRRYTHGNSTGNKTKVSVTLLIYTNHIDDAVKTCEELKSIKLSGVDVVVVNDSREALQLPLKQQERLRNKKVRLYSRRTPATTDVVLAEAYKRSRRGDVVIVTDSQSVSDSLIIVQTADQVRRGAALRIAGYERNVTSVQSLLLTFGDVTRAIFAEAMSLLSFIPTVRIGRRVGYVYAKQDFRAYGRTPRLRWEFEPTLHVLRSGRKTRIPAGDTSIDPLRTIVGITFIVLLGFGSYLAATHQDASLLLHTWFIFAGWLGIAALVNRSMSFSAKATMLLALPLSPFLIATGFMINGTTSLLHRINAYALVRR